MAIPRWRGVRRRRATEPRNKGFVDDPRLIKHGHHRAPPTPPTTPPWTPPPCDLLEDHDPYLSGLPVLPAELVVAHPPVTAGANDSLQSFVFTFRVPRNHSLSVSDDNSYTLHAEILRKSRPSTHLEAAPIFAYLCGGPGSGQQPHRHQELNRYVTSNGFQLLLLDYRGCGHSQPLTVETVLTARTQDGRTEEDETAAAVREFQDVRQGNIVRDFEAVRRYLIGAIPGQRAVDDRLTLLGQSYGGWIALIYAERYPCSVRAVLLTGGMPPIGATPREVYSRLFECVKTANEEFYERYPDADGLVKRIAEEILTQEEGSSARTCTGLDQRDSQRDRLSLTTFASLGRILGEPDGGDKLYERLKLIERKLIHEGKKVHSDATISDLVFADVDTHRFNERLIYAVDHEIQCYVGSAGHTSRWAAMSVRDHGSNRDNYSWLSCQTPAELEGEKQPLHFLGEAFMPEHADDYSGLRRLGGWEFADAVVSAGQTETLWDLGRLRRNRVPVFAIIYRGDMYVDAGLAEEAAGRVGSVVSVRLPESSRLRHNAVRESTGEVVDIFRRMGYMGFEKDPE